MAHGREADAYDYLATSKVSELTIAQLEQALENSFLNKSNIEFWQGPVLMHKLLEVSRTYPGAGMPIPEAGTVLAEEVGVLAQITLQPEGTEIWDVKAIRGSGVGGACTTTMTFASTAGSVDIRVGDTIAQAGTNYDLNDKISSPLLLTNSLYLKIQETGGVNGLRIQMAYQVVSL